MKPGIYLLLTYVILFTSNSVYSQSFEINNQAIHTLREFYTAYSKIEFTVKNLHQLDSLQKKYCSLKLRAELKNEFQTNGLDHDLLTNDHGINSEALKSLTINNDVGKANGYIVCYLNKTISAANKPILEKVILHISLTKENGAFKILYIRS